MNMIKKMFLMVALVGLIIGSNSLAAVRYFDNWGVEPNTAPNGLWTTNNNWFGVPTASDWAVLRETNRPEKSKTACLIDSSVNAEALQFQIGWNQNGIKSQPVTLNMTGGTLTLGAGSSYGDFYIGYDIDAIGDFNMSGGTVSSNRDVYVGRQGNGMLTITGGTINIARALYVGAFDGTGQLNLDGGVINVGYWWLAMTAPIGGTESNGRIDITKGVMTIVEHDPYDPYDNAGLRIQEYVGYGWITAYGGEGTIVTDYDVTNPGLTTVRAAPPGDLNLDCKVNFIDFATLASTWTYSAEDMQDLALLAKYWLN
jgi:T5SS/PEP-CTERM-associated repeat protein